ncbi:hypothetical protein E3O19_01465 [Cryobacterium algoritolerans]|uniref:Uncharacterized protein n=1 Tax=Cryobacterium algoritolerans TaxID=1259184 RepID=A0A4R8X1W2_9MICO|nr:hypothetical protein [Cryobacterium algoritolerans]TFC20067.1 hypothetical protein E3O19_01465 [Cryobacterium algoritolerans]
MPTTTPLSPEVRVSIGDHIAMKWGRNEIARHFNVSPGVVSKIARERGLGFENTLMTADATRCHQIDMWAQRVDREQELFERYAALPGTSKADGTPTKREKRLSYALYNVTRHHNGVYR